MHFLGRRQSEGKKIKQLTITWVNCYSSCGTRSTAWDERPIKWRGFVSRRFPQIVQMSKEREVHNREGYISKTRKQEMSTGFTFNVLKSIASKIITVTGLLQDLCKGPEFLLYGVTVLRFGWPKRHLVRWAARCKSDSTLRLWLPV